MTDSLFHLAFPIHDGESAIRSNRVQHYTHQSVIFGERDMPEVGDGGQAQ